MYIIFRILLLEIGLLVAFSSIALCEQQCIYHEVIKTVRGDSMVPLYSNGQDVTLIENYYCDHTPQMGDIIAYQQTNVNNPLIKIVRATPVDMLHISANFLVINGVVMANSVGTPYTFSSPELNMIQLYITGGHLPPYAYFIFGDNTGNGKDSRKFGAVSLSSLIGKFSTK